jgi:hypothetical protein
MRQELCKWCLTKPIEKVHKQGRRIYCSDCAKKASGKENFVQNIQVRMFKRLFRAFVRRKTCLEAFCMALGATNDAHFDQLKADYPVKLSSLM